MTPILILNGIVGLCLAYAAHDAYRKKNERDAKLLATFSGCALAVTTATAAYVFQFGW